MESESLRDIIDQETIDWAELQFAKLDDFSSEGESTAAISDIVLAMERHMVQYMWALVTKTKYLGEDEVSWAKTRVFFRLIKLLCDVGLSDDGGRGRSFRC